MQKNNKLNKAIDVLMKFLDDRNHDRLIALHKGNLTAKLETLRNMHDISKSMSIENISLEKGG